MKYLITGAKGTLGSYLCTRLSQPDFAGWNKVVPISRNDKLPKEFDGTIIHCARSSECNYTEDVNFTKTLIKKYRGQWAYFIFISSLDIYADKLTDYAISKIASESILKDVSSNILSLRCGSILCPGMKKNSIIRLLQNENTTISALSLFRPVLAEDIFQTLFTCYDRSCGMADFETLDMASESGQSIFASKINPQFTGQYGGFEYICPKGNPSEIEFLKRPAIHTVKIASSYKIRKD